MAATLVAVLVVIAIFTAGGGGMALARPDAHMQNELAQESDDNGWGYSGDVVDGAHPSPGDGHELNPPTDSGDSSSAPTDDGSIPEAPTQSDHKPYTADVPTYGSTPTDNIPHIPEVPMQGIGEGSC
ncbi:hypothetical protein KI387_034618, partial [Taxus chinensis]